MALNGLFCADVPLKNYLLTCILISIFFHSEYCYTVNNKIKDNTIKQLHLG